MMQYAPEELPASSSTGTSIIVGSWEPEVDDGENAKSLKKSI